MNWSIRLLKNISKAVFKTFKCCRVSYTYGKRIPYLGAETENERSNTDVRDLGTAREPFDDDLRLRSCVSATGFNNSDIY